MNTKIIGIALAVTIVSGGLAVAEGSKAHSKNGTNVHAMRMDRCPYYPSPVVCRDFSRAHTASNASQAAVDVEETN
jgi:hypothetical protein